MAGLFKLMMREEYRLHVSYSSKLTFLSLPIFVVVLSAIFASTYPMMEDNFALSQMVSLVHVGMFIYGLSIGAFGFLGRSFIERRYGKNNFLIAMPYLLPLTFRQAYAGMFLRDLLFYSVLILLPALGGLSIASLVVGYHLVSILCLFVALFISFLLGISLSFAISVLYTRSRLAFLIASLSLVALIFALGVLQLFPLEWLLPSLGMQWHLPPYSIDLGQVLSYLLIASVWISLAIIVALALVRPEREERVARFPQRFLSYRSKLHLLRSYDSLMAKEMIDVVRSGLAGKMVFAYVVPMVFLSLSTWYVNTGLNIPVGFNAVFYAGMVGFFSVLVYNWLTNMDLHDYYETMPVDVPTVIRTKMIVYFLLTTVISAAFVIFISLTQGEARLVWVALPVLFIVSIYMVVCTAYLTGLRTSSFLFDPSVMGKFTALSLLPDLGITILSFSIETSPLTALAGIAIVCFLLLGVAKVFYDGIDRKWGRTEFT